MGLIHSSDIPEDEYDQIGLPVLYEHRAHEGGRVEFVRIQPRMSQKVELKYAMSSGFINVGKRCYTVVAGAELHVQHGALVEPGTLLASWCPSQRTIVAQMPGRVEYEGCDVQKDGFIDELSGHRCLYIEDFYRPVMLRVFQGGVAIQSHQVYGDLLLNVEPGRLVEEGDAIVTIRGVSAFQTDPEPTLPSFQELKARFLGYLETDQELGLDNLSPYRIRSAAFGLIKLMADLEVEEVFDGLSDDMRGRVLAILKDGYPLTYGGTFGEAKWELINSRTDQLIAISAESRFNLGLNRLRAWQKGS